jgi:hypothetical protein
MWCSRPPGELDSTGQSVVPTLHPVVVMSLSEVREQIALRRVSECRIAILQGTYFDHGQCSE